MIKHNIRPADVLVPNWSIGKLAPLVQSGSVGRACSFSGPLWLSVSCMILITQSAQNWAGNAHTSSRDLYGYWGTETMATLSIYQGGTPATFDISSHTTCVTL